MDGIVAGEVAYDIGLLDFENLRVRSQLAKEFPLSEELLHVYEVEPGTVRKDAVIVRLLVDDKVVGASSGEVA
jgi:hypothetical protein